MRELFDRIDCLVQVDIKPSLFGIHLNKLTEYDDTTLSDTQPQKSIPMESPLLGAIPQ